MTKSTADVLQDGALAGVIGYAIISLYFAALNLLLGVSPWYTLETISHALFGPGSPGPLIAYNGLHLVVFLMLGIIAAYMVQEVELHPAFWYAIFFIFISAFMFGYLLLVVLSDALAPLRPATIAVGNGITALAMGGYLLWRHPKMVASVKNEVTREDVEAFGH
jgi:hypothetical protein